MDRTNNQANPLSLDSQVDEDRVRRALGLKTNSGTHTHQQRPEQARQRHRFVSDGAVPVVMLNRSGEGEAGGLKERLTAAEAALEAERGAHAATRRSLNEAQAAMQTLQTRLGHADLTHREAMGAEREARRVAEEALISVRAELAEAKRPVVAEPKRAVAAEVEGPVPTEAPRDEAPVRTVRAAVPRKPRVPKVEKEPKPVRWWTPSFKAKKKG